VSNHTNRYEKETRIATSDGWNDGSTPPDDDDLPPLRTTLIKDASRTIIARNTSPDISFDRSINPYRGCEHGCVYCFARPTHAWLGFSPGLDFETRILFKPDAAKLLRKELSDPKYQCRMIAMGTNTDPYQPVERQMQITRSIVRTLADFRHPLGMVTKNHLITRDIDILKEMAQDHLVECFLSITTLDAELARTMEPRASTPRRRLDAIEALAKAGIPVGVMTAPMIPALNDHEMESILEEAHKRGARRAGYVMLRLPLEIKDLFREWLEAHVPDRAARVMSLVRQMRGGKDYDAEWGQRMTGEGPVAQLLGQRFDRACRQLGLNVERFHVDTKKFKVPAEAIAERNGGQLSLL
ncbi:MAG: radical protein, partial [Alphaproteobacteria bacterium]|nr:radical protein [Alphaproteobacteria bacterium]